MLTNKKIIRNCDESHFYPYEGIFLVQKDNKNFKLPLLHSHVWSLIDGKRDLNSIADEFSNDKVLMKIVFDLKKMKLIDEN